MPAGVLADWLEERGDPRAESVRLGIGAMPDATRIVVREHHRSRERSVALIDVVTPSDLRSPQAIEAFASATFDCVLDGLAMIVVRVHPLPNADWRTPSEVGWDRVYGLPQPRGRQRGDLFSLTSTHPGTLLGWDHFSLTTRCSLGAPLLHLPIPNPVWTPLQEAYDRAFESIPPAVRREVETFPTMTSAATWPP